MKVYLDNAATTRAYDEVIDCMNDIQRNDYGNPSSAHSMGMEAEKAVKTAGDIISRTLNAGRDNIVFTSGGTEADNMALMQPFFDITKVKGRKIITSSVEHPAINQMCDYLGDCGAEVFNVPVDKSGLIDLDSLEGAANDKSDNAMPAAISIMMVNNEVGTIQPIRDICKIKKQAVQAGNRELLLHSDAVQAYGKMNIDINSGEYSAIDYLSLSAHKIHGPKGTGVLYTKNPEKTKPLVRGGGQQRGLRSGTENVAGIAGFGCAASIQHENLIDKMNKIAGLRKQLMEGLLESIDNIKINSPVEASSNGEPGKCIPTILSVSFPGTKGEVILHSLEQNGIFVSTESACSSKKRGNSPVLTAMGLNPEEIEGTIRFSLSVFNTEDEIMYTIKETEKAVTKFRKLTGYRIR